MKRNQWNPYPQETIDQCRTLYVGGMSCVQVGRAIALGSSTVRGLLVRNGVKLRSRADGVARAWREGRISRHMPTGERHHNWHGGIVVADGYVAVREKRGQRSYIAQHRLVVEKALGRQLSAGEIVHHMNGDKRDNRINNLQIMSRAEHARHHIFERWREKSA